MKKFLILMVNMLIVSIVLAQNNENIFTAKIGLFEISLLSEGQQSGRTNILKDATPEMLREYVPEGSFPNSCNAFLIKTPDKNILIDAGFGRNLFDNLESLGVEASQIDAVLITHMHGDHIGGLFQNNARRFPNAKVLSTKPEYEQLAKVKSAYGQDFTTFNFDDEVFANAHVKVKAINAEGHTAGHTAFWIESTKAEDEGLMIVGDLLHAVALQFPVPEACARFDIDHEKAIASRKRILDEAAKGKYPIAGMHFPAPHIGKVEK
ncbi:MAG: MBL fold metallo-hydrolase, partial [Prolixibacteraceae bacterium]|nr:MBL fold metallo-hydrolase [Prolixibacteraceae bacterium]